ncbi:hypothetical protein K488DRAFT_83285 [Vararia minispora EC-137]|uniref:Uncharacterized protein n=1 Tax=Vararia minispora EC-137 TaxID=1314806 RepID=A0ACB8QU61_9AGAM|nr:hypothetical protein K488DRAFT_83285 [Vararia minispora EC-137]
MTTQLLNYKPDPTKAAPPDPHHVLAPYMNPLTLEHARYTVWEQDRIKEFLVAQPDPHERDSETTKNELKTGLRQYSRRIKLILAGASRLDTVNDKHRANLGCILAEAVYKTKIFACRIMDINQFPTEILNQVLDVAVRTGPHIMEARFPLTWVCRRWRSIIIANQSLWGVLQINDMPPFSRTSEILERAGLCPLEIRILDPFTEWKDLGPSGLPPPVVPGGYTSEVIEEVMDLLLPRLDRLIHLVVVLKELTSALTLLDRFHRAPQIPTLLERFEIHRTGAIQHYESLLWSKFQHAFTFCNGRLSSLKVLILNGVHIDWTGTPLPELRHFDVRRIEPQHAPGLPDLRYILRNAPLLHTLLLNSLELTSYDPTALVNFQAYRLPCLRSLALGGLTLDQALCVLQSIDAPGVIELNIRSHPQRIAGSQSMPIFNALIGKFPNVRILQLTDFLSAPSPLDQATATLGRWLASMPFIEVLRAEAIATPFLSHFPMADSRFCVGPSYPTTAAEQAAINIEAANPQWVLPRLRCILISEVDLGALFTLLQWRIEIGHPIKRLYVPGEWFNGEGINDAQRTAIRTVTDVQGINGIGLNSPEENVIWGEVSKADLHSRSIGK